MGRMLTRLTGLVTLCLINLSSIRAHKRLMESRAVGSGTLHAMLSQQSSATVTVSLLIITDPEAHCMKGRPTVSAVDVRAYSNADRTRVPLQLACLLSQRIACDGGRGSQKMIGRRSSILAASRPNNISYSSSSPMGKGRQENLRERWNDHSWSPTQREASERSMMRKICGGGAVDWNDSGK